MDFGKLSKFDVERVDFTLSQDNAFNLEVLTGTKSTKPKIWIGCPIWANKDWNGKIYPFNAKNQDYLSLYAKQFNTIELNVTHYQIPNEETINRWLTETENGFLFCPKFPQVISHDKQLQNTQELSQLFCNNILTLGDKLGSSFLQLAPQFGPRQLPILEKYIQSIPQSLKFSVEFRNEDWFKNPTIWQNTLQMLKSYQVGTVITDVAGRRDVCHQSLSTTTAMIRWVGNEHPSDYKRIDEWVQRIKQWLDTGLEELYIFVHICENTIAPEMANYWIQELNLHCNLEINPPKFLPKIEQMSLF